MDIVVENGLGLPTANAYLTTDEADDLLSVNIYSTWGALPDDAKEALIMWASQLLDQRVKWAGKKVHPTSGLAWPRYGTRDKEGMLVSSSTVPTAVKLATAVLADFLRANAGDPEAVDTSNNLTGLTVDVIKLSFDANVMKNKYPVQVRNILAGLGVVNMGRGGPKFITVY